MKSVVDNDGVHTLPTDFNRLSNFEEDSEVRLSSCRDIVIRVNTKITQLLDEGSLETKTHKLVVNKRMQDGSKYLGQVCKHTKG